jgi:hypothetical protein
MVFLNNIKVNIMEKAGGKQNILFQWLVFYFFDGPKAILKAWRNFLLFNLNYFSIGLLIKTLFSYWRNYRWAYPRGFEVSGYLEAAAGNLISRILGALMRIFLIIIGVVTEIFLFAAAIITFTGWFFLLFLAVILIYNGFKILF